MPHFLCAACGTQFAESGDPPDFCPICSDDRQFIPESGQAWTSCDLIGRDHGLVWQDLAPGVTSLTLSPHFGIGQRAFFLETAGGNILWDCLSLVDDAGISRIRERGGLAAIAISHPHYYTAMVEWSKAFDGVPIYLHEDDAQWIQRPDEAIRLWSGERLDLDGPVRLVRCGGHFPGGTVLHWPGYRPGNRQPGPGAGGAMFTGDILQVAPDRAHVSFMYSYPNMIPLDGDAVRRIARAVSGLEFDIVYGAFPGRTIKTGGRAAVDRSVARYLRAIGAE